MKVEQSSDLGVEQSLEMRVEWSLELKVEQSRVWNSRSVKWGVP